MASIIIAVLVVLAIYAGTKRLTGLQMIGVVALAIAGILLAIFPALSSQVAALLHVGRGTDLIFYFAVLAGLFVATNFYFRIRRHEEALTALARQSAIDHAHRPVPGSPPSVAKSDRPVEQIEQDLHRIEP
jgi:hypothetical protein